MYQSPRVKSYCPSLLSSSWLLTGTQPSDLLASGILSSSRVWFTGSLTSEPAFQGQQTASRGADIDSAALLQHLDTPSPSRCTFHLTAGLLLVVPLETHSINQSTDDHRITGPPISHHSLISTCLFAANENRPRLFRTLETHFTAHVS